MKAFELNGDLFYFNDTVTANDICEWINMNFGEFILNESNSCSCEKQSESTLLITGDEDYVEIDIFNITPIL